MNTLFHQRHRGRVIAVLLGVAVAAAVCIGLVLHFGPSAVSTEQKTLILHDGDTLDHVVNVSKGTYLVVKSDDEDQDANVKVTRKGGFVVEKGAVLALENVNFSGGEKDRSRPVFSVYGDMVMNDGAVGDFSSTSSGTSSDYGEGGVPAICVVDGTFTMNDGLISGNRSTTTKATAFGGALRAEGKNASVVINDGTISGNKVLSSAEVPDGSTVTANALGGAIAVTDGASITVNGGEISDNTAGSHDANAKSAECTVCSGSGGAIAVYSSDRDAVSSLYLDGGTISNNNAYRTGANKGESASAKNETHGGGIFSNVYTKAVLTSGKISGNTSDDKGGGVFLDCEKSCGGATFRNTLITGNEAESLGGGLWFCPNGESDMFSEAKADGVAVFDNSTSRRGASGAGDDLYVSPRSGNTGVSLTSTMPGGGSNAWYKDGGASTQKTSSGSVRYTTSDTKESATLLQASAVVNKPSSKARTCAEDSAKVVITGNRSTYGGGVGSNHYLSFGTPTSEEQEENNVPDTPETKKISVTVDKVWIGDEGTSATVHLYANGHRKATATLTADSDWSYTFTNLPQTDSNGKKIRYTIKEDQIDGYTSKITGSASSGFTVTNTKKISIPVTKKWVGDAGTEATVHLLANGSEVASTTLTADNGWTYTFTGLDQADSDGNKITYTLTEDEIDGYASEVTGDTDSGFTVTNTKKISIPVTKVWNGGTGNSATVHLLANGSEVASTTLTADNNWKYTFTDLDQADSNGKIDYTLREDSVPGYTSSITGDADSGFTVTNTKETINIPVTKSWICDEGKEGTEATVHLLADGTEVAYATLTADNNWTYTFSDLDKTDSSGNEINYTLTEDPIEGFTSEISGDAEKGFTVTNIQTVSVHVEKQWSQGLEASVTIRAQSVTGSNSNTDTDNKTVTLTAAGGWEGYITDLPKYDAEGKMITYTVKEEKVYDIQGNDVTILYKSTTYNDPNDPYRFIVVNGYSTSG